MTTNGLSGRDNFGYRYAKKSIKGSIDAEIDVVFNKALSQKNGSMGWGSEPDKCGQNFQNMPSLRRHLQKKTTETKKFFFTFYYKTC